jgi:hypothetical protein
MILRDTQQLWVLRHKRSSTSFHGRWKTCSRHKSRCRDAGDGSLQHLMLQDEAIVLPSYRPKRSSKLPLLCAANWVLETTNSKDVYLIT